MDKNTSALSVASGNLIIDTSMDSESENTTVKGVSDSFTLVQTKKQQRSSNKRKAGNDDETSRLTEKRSKPQDNFVVYVKGVNTNITKRPPKAVQQNILNDFGKGIKAQVAGDSLRLICENDVQKQRILAADHLGSDAISASKPYYETSGGHKGSNKGLISDVDFDISLDELVDDNEGVGLIKAQRIFSHAEGNRYPTRSVILEFHDDVERPDYVSFGYREFDVKDFIPKPLRCFHCQGFGHTAKFCKRSVPCCPRCSGKHFFNQCTAEPEQVKCRNCGLQHSAAYKGCPKYGWVKDSLKTAVRTSKSYAEVFKTNKPDLKLRIQAASTDVPAVASKPVMHAPARIAPLNSTPVSSTDVLNTPASALNAPAAARRKPTVSPVRRAASVVKLGQPNKPSINMPSTSSAGANARVENRPQVTPVRKIPTETKIEQTKLSNGNEVVITVDKLIALVIHLVHASGGEITTSVIKTCIDGALDFLGVRMQFCATNCS